MVEVIGPLGDSFERMGQVRLAKGVPRPVVVTITLEDAARLGELCQILVVKVGGLAPSQCVPFSRELDGWSHNSFQTQFAVLLFGIDHAGHRSGHTDRSVPDFTGAGNDISLFVEVHIRLGRSRGFFSIVEEMRFAIGHADEHEPTSTDVARRRMNDC